MKRPTTHKWDDRVLIPYLNGKLDGFYIPLPIDLRPGGVNIVPRYQNLDHFVMCQIENRVPEVFE